MTTALDSVRFPRFLILAVFVAGTIAWSFESHPKGIDYVVVAVSVCVALFTLVAAWRQRDWWLGLAGVAVAFAWWISFAFSVAIVTGLSTLGVTG